MARWLPFRDASRARRLRKVLAWLAGIALVVAALELVGVDVGGWFSSLWDTLTEIQLGYLVAGWSLQTVQTTLTALGWCFILRAGFPGRRCRTCTCWRRTRPASPSTASSPRTSGPS